MIQRFNTLLHCRVTDNSYLSPRNILSARRSLSSIMPLPPQPQRLVTHELVDHTISRSNERDSQHDTQRNQLRWDFSQISEALRDGVAYYMYLVAVHKLRRSKRRYGWLKGRRTNRLVLLSAELLA